MQNFVRRSQSSGSPRGPLAISAGVHWHLVDGTFCSRLSTFSGFELMGTDGYSGFVAKSGRFEWGAPVGMWE
jgi:hypothetical protein